jgi:hypothetical protein
MENDNSFIKFNVNKHVYVKLTDSGILHYLNYYNNNWKNKISKEDFIKRANPKGYYEFQLHEFMEVFGDSVIMMNHFDTNVYFKTKELNT